ncbi:hypothetical protein CY35_18G097400 [Sphagnum magellanicum]|nr:hypothetical protein CY35_18G097400 [Sphagnum magellanicum]KAH9534240.1 hypothetical protein CY35_18G097400 [Sphagnum magellanicum]
MSKLMRSRRLLPSLLLRRCFHGQRASPVHLQQRQKISSAAATRGGIDDAQQQDVRRLWSRATFSRSKFASGYTALTPKSLDSIMKIDTVRYTSPQEIIAIWNDYHIGRGHISAGMGRDLYKLLQQRANQCPLFVLPLRKGNGFVSILVQAQMPHMLFTSLDDYRARGSAASPYFTVTHYTDLMDSKGVVLVRGDIVFTSRLSDEEAKTLLETAHSFYLDDSRYKKVWRFNKESEDFDFKEVLQELNMPTGS